jgi:hypothetical protein
VQLEVAFIGAGRVVERPRGTFRGGVPDPRLSSQAGFNVLPVSPEEDGTLIPDQAGSYEGPVQINVWGTANDFRELARYLLGIAELDTTADPRFHQHHDELMSDDGRTQVALIVRKLPEPAA